MLTPFKGNVSFSAANVRTIREPPGDADSCQISFTTCCYYCAGADVDRVYS